MSAGGIHVRHAEPSDYEAVLAILPDVYGGADYMPHKYLTYFTDPKAHPYVAEVDGAVVAFANCYVVDGGLTAVATGLRVQQQYEGQGLVSATTTASFNAALIRYPQITTEARVVIDAEVFTQYRVPNPRGRHITYEQAFLQYITTKPQIMQLLSHLEASTRVDITNTRHLDHVTAAAILPDRLLRSQLFPHKSFVTASSYIPLKVNHENLSLACSNTDVVASFADSLLGVGVIRTNGTHTDSKHKVDSTHVDNAQSSSDSATNTAEDECSCTAVSFAVCPLAKVGPALTIFSHVSTTRELFAHIKAYLQLNRNAFQGTGGANLELSFPLALPMEEVKGRLLPFLGKNNIYSDARRETIMIIEQPIYKLPPQL